MADLERTRKRYPLDDNRIERLETALKPLR